MTLADITLPVAYGWGREHALVFGQALLERLMELHSEYCPQDCYVQPLRLSDGRWMMVATVLTATEPGGYLHEMWLHADMSVLLPAVEVVPIGDALALLPVEAEE